MHQSFKSLGLITVTVLLSLVSPLLLPETTSGSSIAQAQTPTAQQRKTEADRLFQEGIQQYRRGQYRQALATYQRVLEIRRQLGDKLGEAATLNNLGEVYNWLRQNDQALEVLQ